MKVGDREVDVHQAFRLYLTTKLGNPNFSPEVCARVAVIDFTVTRRGLEDQLLSLVIANERSVSALMQSASFTVPFRP